MKFTDGFWLAKPGVTLSHASHVRDIRVSNDSVTLYCTKTPITHRGMTLGGPILTLTFTSPAPNIIALKTEHYQGGAAKEPKAKLYGEPSELVVHEDKETITISAGRLKAVVTKERFRLDYYYENERLTGLADRHLSYAQTPSGSHIRVKLDVDVAEKLYGLGERFTPFVKNGQSVDIWNEDGGTASELAYKSIPFYASTKGYGVFVNSFGRVSYELCSEAVQSAQFSLPGESLEYMVVAGPTVKEAVSRFVRLTGKPALPPAWTFGLWLSTSFTTDYNEETIRKFTDGMVERGIPLQVFHFDCFWMKEMEWCNFTWDEAMFPDPVGMLKRLHDKGLKVCVWINPYIAQKSRLFEEGKRGGYLLKRPDGGVWQWDMWQPGMGIVDFTNPNAVAWYQSKLKALLDMGVDCFKTDFGERIPTDCVYHDGSDPILMHNCYTSLYNAAVFDLLRRERGDGEACVFARSATIGGQQFPVHWGGDSTSNYPSMAESLRAGLSLSMSGFAFWSHDISGFEDMASPDVYKRWLAFGLLSTHSRLHGSGSYRVPWLFGEESVDVARFFTRLKYRLMPYIFAKAVEARDTGVPVMRAMVMEFPDDPACHDLDRQYMLGDSILVAPVFRADGVVTYYLPKGKWTHIISNEVVDGGSWRTEEYSFMSLPLYARQGSIVAMGTIDDRADYDYRTNCELHAYGLLDGESSSAILYDARGGHPTQVVVTSSNGSLSVTANGEPCDMKVR